MNGKANRMVTNFLWVIIFAFVLLVGRLFYLQILHGESYLLRSQSNFIQERIIKHSRGKILDNEGHALADNRPAYDLYVTFALLPNGLKNVRSLAQSLGLSFKDAQDINQELSAMAKANIDHNLLIKSGLALDLCERVAEFSRIKMLSGVEIERLNHSQCQILLATKRFPTETQTFNRLLELLGAQRANLEDLWHKAQKKSQGLGRFKPVLLQSDIGFDAYARIENAISLGSLAGVTVVPSQRRRYVHGDLATHVIGFVNQVSLVDIQGKGAYRSGDFIGRNGLEATYENVLRGGDGVERVVVDAKGRRFDDPSEQALLGSERTVLPRAGQSLRLSINSALQRSVQDLFTGLSGSIIVSEAATGFILAMASFPGFDANGLVMADNSKFYQALLSDKAKPLRNKAIQDHYAPGSIFKPITAIAGLNKRLVTVNSRHYCSGLYQIHRTQWRCFKREGHGPIALVDALKVSCDGYFYELGHRMGLESLAEVGEMFGFGAKTEIPLLGETSGILPNKEYYKKGPGYVAPGFVVNMAIGQGDLSTSPIQIAMAYGAMANGGTVYKPQLVKEIINDRGEVVKVFPTIVRSSLTDSSLRFDEILHGLSFVTDAGGSAHSLRYRKEFDDIAQWLKKENISIVGKTGTAQVVKLAKNVKHLYNLSEVPYEQRDHAWFAGVYPKNNPKIVVVAMVEHGGFGGSTTAPVVVRAMKKWHELNSYDVHVP